MIVIILRCEYTSNTLINRENTESTGAFIRFYTLLYARMYKRD